MKQPDLYYFETIQNLTIFVTSFLWFQNGIDQAVSLNKC